MANSKMNNNSHSDMDSDEQHRHLLNDLSGHIRDLEEKRARGIPIISLVDNMVKLGSLYRGPQDAPLSHRVRNIPVERNQRPMVASYDIQQHEEQQHLSKQRRADIQVLKQDRFTNGCIECASGFNGIFLMREGVREGS